MDEQQVRALVRQAIARHMGPGDGPVASGPGAGPPSRRAAVTAPAEVKAEAAGAISYAHFHLERPAGEVECLIEPAVTCNHCGYCLCYGH